MAGDLVARFADEIQERVPEAHIELRPVVINNMVSDIWVNVNDTVIALLPDRLASSFTALVDDYRFEDMSAPEALGLVVALARGDAHVRVERSKVLGRIATLAVASPIELTETRKLTGELHPWELRLLEVE